LADGKDHRQHRYLGMQRDLGPNDLDPKTPKSVKVTAEARAPVDDPTLGISVAPPDGSRAAHRLVTLGDSLTHGFQSGAIYNTHISWPMIVAWEMGWDSHLRYPKYEGFGGLPLNIEYILRKMENAFGAALSWWELPAALFEVRHLMAQIEDWWERGPGSAFPNLKGINHNLAVYGWDVRDALDRTAAKCSRDIVAPKDDLLAQVVENANDRAALHVLNSARAGDGNGRYLSPVDAAAELHKQGKIETLVVFLGANNALGSVVALDLRWSQINADDPTDTTKSPPDFQDLDRKRAFTVWDPVHFKAELDALVAKINGIDAAHVIWATVPHVTIAPVAKGVGNKIVPGSRYYPYYTYAWIAESAFNPSDDPCITAAEARAVDSAIDQYNEDITEAVKQARRQGKDWYLLDVAGILDRMASRRYIEDPNARPSWWTGPYELPPALAALDPPLTSKFFASGPTGRTAGGLFSLDGVHPTTVCYGILAQEFIRVMERARVKFYFGDSQTVRPGPVLVDFKRLLTLDTLVSAPPAALGSITDVVGWLHHKFDVVTRMLGRRL
jgi:hypothetical protein